MLERIKGILRTIAKWSCVALLASAIMLAIAFHVETVRPTTPREIQKIAVEVLTATGAGSGTILRSSSKGSDILTNAHVCDDAPKQGAIVVTDKKKYRATAIKMSKKVDLCLVHVDENLRVQVEIAEYPTEFGEELLMGGHPLGMPLLVQKGYASKVFDSEEIVMLTSFLVQPGHSGSGVFDSNGQLVGVILAFNNPSKQDYIGFGLAIPQRLIKNFVEREAPKTKWIKVPK